MGSPQPDPERRGLTPGKQMDAGARVAGRSRRDVTGRSHCACSLRRGRSSSPAVPRQSSRPRPAPPRPAPPLAAGSGAGRASGVSTPNHGYLTTAAPRPPAGTREGWQTRQPVTKGPGGGRGPPRRPFHLVLGMCSRDLETKEVK